MSRRKLPKVDPCQITHRDWRVPLPLDLGELAVTTDKLRGQGYLLEPRREATEDEIFAAAVRMARQRLDGLVDDLVADVKGKR